MPIDVMITYADGKQELINIPLRIMRGHKEFEATSDLKFKVVEDWPWTNPVYELVLDHKLA